MNESDVHMNEVVWHVRKQEWVKIVSRPSGGYVRVRNEGGESYYTHLSNLMEREDDTVSVYGE